MLSTKKLIYKICEKIGVMNPIVEAVAPAVDEDNPLIMFKVYSYKRTTALNAGSSFSITGNDVSLTAPAGYSVMGVRSAYSDEAQADIHQFRIGTGNGQLVRVRNGSSSAISNFNVYVGVNFIRDDFYKQLP